MEEKIALVTGSNKGIGYELVKQLSEKGYRVILTSRNKDNGERAVKSLGKDNVLFHLLDITSKKSIEEMKDFVNEKFGRLDVLINNAGILLDEDSHRGNNVGPTKLNPEALRKTLETNTIGAFRMIQKMVPLLKKSEHPRIVNVSSGFGQLSTMEGNYAIAYKISKAALNAVTRVFAFDSDTKGILVNSVCPGWVRTDMGGKEAALSIEDGAKNVIWLAEIPNTGPNGQFFSGKLETDW